MPHYFFHVTGSAPFVDAEGVELTDDDAAWSMAIISFGELLKDLDGRMPDRSELMITVRDDKERRVALLRFAGQRGVGAVDGFSSDHLDGHADDRLHDDFRSIRLQEEDASITRLPDRDEVHNREN